VDGNRIGAVGICTGASYLAPTVAGDDRIKAWAAVAGFFQDAAQLRRWMGQEYDLTLEQAAAERERFEDTGEARVIPAIGGDEAEIPKEMAVPPAEARAYFGTSRGRAPTYVNALAVMSREHTLRWDAQACAYDISVPTLVIHSESAVAPDLARRFFLALNDLKEQVWMASNGHVDFYDEPKRIGAAADHLARHFRAHL
jgi:hypothetical protein